jgi:hypothetical protein
MNRSCVSSELVDAYRAAEYRVERGAGSFCFHIQQHSPPLARLLADTGQASAFFITAYNPYSEPQDTAANRAAHARLQQRLRSLTQDLFDAVGVDVSGEWPAEPGYLAVGVPRETAHAVGNEFRQNAIVWIGPDALPELMLLR